MILSNSEALAIFDKLTKIIYSDIEWKYKKIAQQVKKQAFYS